MLSPANAAINKTRQIYDSVINQSIGNTLNWEINLSAESISPQMKPNYSWSNSPPRDRDRDRVKEGTRDRDGVKEGTRDVDGVKDGVNVGARGGVKESTLGHPRGSWGSISHSPVLQLVRPRGNSDVSTDRDNERTDRETPHSSMSGPLGVTNDFSLEFSNNWELLNEHNGISVYEMVSTYGIGTTVYAVSCNIQVRIFELFHIANYIYLHD